MSNGRPRGPQFTGTPFQTQLGPLPISGAAEPRVVVVLPTYNEGATIGKVVAGVLATGPTVHVLVVDETCDTGDTLRLAVAAIVNAGAAEVHTAVAFQTGPYQADFHGLATESTIVLPWDREVLIEGELLPNPVYAEALKAAP